nr:MAG TPA: DNA primase [Caudoviricetes sp.]
MNRNDYIKEQIRERVSIRQAVEFYTDKKLDSRGFCSCPLHTEKTASFKISEEKKLFYCFGCGQGGDVITLVQRYLGMNFREALKQIDKDFSLGLSGERISVSAQIKARKAKEKRALEEYEKEQKNALYDDLCVKYQLVNELLKHLEPMTRAWGQMLTRKAWLEYELDKAMEGICK